MVGPKPDDLKRPYEHTIHIACACVCFVCFLVCTILCRCLETLDELSGTEEFAHFNNISVLDLNLGCPSPAVTDAGAGAALLRRRGRLRLLFSCVRDWAKQTPLAIKAVGCKIRLGFDAEEASHKVYLPVVEAASEFLDYVVVHARHAQQRSDDPINEDALKECVQLVRSLSAWRLSNGVFSPTDGSPRLSIFGNGDVVCSDGIKAMHRTGVDGVMVARAALRNPWIFSALNLSASKIWKDTAVEVDTVSPIEQSPGLPPRDVIEAAQRTYLERSMQWESKDKFRDFHIGNFQRLCNLSGTSIDPMTVPMRFPRAAERHLQCVSVTN